MPRLEQLVLKPPFFELLTRKSGCLEEKRKKCCLNQKCVCFIIWIQIRGLLWEPSCIYKNNRVCFSAFLVTKTFSHFEVRWWHPCCSQTAESRSQPSPQPASTGASPVYEQNVGKRNKHLKMTLKNITAQKHSVNFYSNGIKRNLRKLPVLWDWITIILWGKSVFCIWWCEDKLDH